jgi:hypothetical protein
MTSLYVALSLSPVWWDILFGDQPLFNSNYDRKNFKLLLTLWSDRRRFTGREERVRIFSIHSKQRPSSKLLYTKEVGERKKEINKKMKRYKERKQEESMKHITSRTVSKCRHF